MAKIDPLSALDSQLILWTALVGAILQGLVELAAWHWPGLGVLAILFARAMAAATAGYLYGLVQGKGYGSSACGGAIAGGLGVVVGLGAALVLAQPEIMSPIRSAGLAVLMGAVGGVFGQLGAVLRSLAR